MDEEWARKLIQSMGFDEVAATQALEIADSSFSRALLILLHGNDEDKSNSPLPQTHIAQHYRFE